MSESSAGSGVGRVLRAYAHDVRATRAAALVDRPDGVHAHRIRVHRLRAVLVALRDELDPVVTVPLAVALRRWGRELGVVRDAEVRAAALAGAVDRAASDEERALVDAAIADHVRLRARLVAIGGLPRSEALAAALQRLERATPETDADGREALGVVLRREARRIRRAARGQDGSSAAEHELRKAARRLRFVAAALHEADPVLFGGEIVRVARAAKRLQRTLGDHRDAVVLVARLERARAVSRHRGQPTAAIGRAIARLRAEAAGHEATISGDLARLLRRTRRARRRAWGRIPPPAHP